MNKQLEKRNNVLFDKLVQRTGKSNFIEGEMLRAINRIAYRFYNDGDVYYEGYGCETAGPAHSFLINCTEINSVLQDKTRKAFDKECYAHDDEIYEAGLETVLTLIIDYIEGLENYTETDQEMFDYEAEYEYEDEEEEEEVDDWNDDED